MKVYGLHISDDRGLTNIDLYSYARELKIDNFRGVFMRDTLPRIPYALPPPHSQLTIDIVN